MKHTETKKKVMQHINREELKDVHFVRSAYGLPCGTCVYSDYCKKMGYNKDNFVREVITNA